MQLRWFRKAESATPEQTIEAEVNAEEVDRPSTVTPDTVTQQQSHGEESSTARSQKDIDRLDIEEKLNIFQRAALRMARFPRTHFWISFLLAFGLSAFAFIVGDFSVAADNDGWRSRGTLIANRRQQAMLIYYNQYNLFGDETGAVWTDLEENVQQSWDEETE